MDALITEEDGLLMAIAPEVSLLVHKAESAVNMLGVEEPLIFHRNGIKWHPDSSESETVRWLVGQLKGVRVYISEESGGLKVILSDMNLRP